MSLISPRNLLAPLQNKVHFFTIVLIAVAFLVLRLSGGSVAIREENQPSRLKGEARGQVEAEGKSLSRTGAQAEPDLMLDPRKEAERLGLQPVPDNNPPEASALSPRDKNLINEMLRNSDKKKTVAPAGESERLPEPKKGENALDEIEHSLGLR